MCLECIVGWSILGIAAAGYVVCYFIKNTNWDLHAFYFKKLFMHR
jgi:hypothetical protein